MPEYSIPITYLDRVSAPPALTSETALAFVCFVFSDEAWRPSVRGRHQKLPLHGRHISYGVKARLRGSDRAERIYVAVTALQKARQSNYQSCCEVAARLESKLGKSRRGRRRRSPYPPEFADKVETVRSIYNKFKLRHPWKEKLLERDFVYEQWYWRFRFYQRWVANTLLPPIRGRVSGQSFAEELALRRGQGGRLNYEALISLGENGLIACLNSQLDETQPGLDSREVKRFAREFFDWRQSEDRKEV